MSNSNNYLPNPPRVWSRVQNPCTYIVPDNSYNSIYIPLTNQTVSLAQANLEEKIQYKGNILQYKGNSSRITKNQRYSQISRGLWCNRTKVFATQTQTYTNPNTISLARVNFTSIPFPNQIVGSPNNISGPFQYGIPNPNNCNTTTIQDGGSLLCGSYANPCTGEIVQTVSEQQCFPTYCSDVPGQIMDLCWNPKLQTFFPRNRLTMSNSLNKWPQGYKGLISAVTPVPPVLTLVSSTNTTVTLSWTIPNNECFPISAFNIYQNGIIVTTVSYTVTTITLNLVCGNNSFYVTAISYNTESLPSNIITTTFVPLDTVAPVLTLVSSTNSTATLSWSTSNNECFPISAFNIYQNGIIVTTVSYTVTTITLNLVCGNNSFYVTAISYNTESLPSNTILVTTSVPNFLNGYFTSPSTSTPNTFEQLFTPPNPQTNNTTNLTNWLSNCTCSTSNLFTLYICDGNIIFNTVTLNPPLPSGVNTYIGFLGNVINEPTSVLASISQTINITTTICPVELSFYTAPSNPASSYATYQASNNNIQINVYDALNVQVFNATITIDPSSWVWTLNTFTIPITGPGNYTFTFVQNITGNYGTNPPPTVGLFFVTGFNLN